MGKVKNEGEKTDWPVYIQESPLLALKKVYTPLVSCLLPTVGKYELEEKHEILSTT
jgi:hypothetical protein